MAIQGLALWVRYDSLRVELDCFVLLVLAMTAQVGHREERIQPLAAIAALRSQ